MSDNHHITEDFIQYIWKFRLFNTIELHTTAGLPITILHPGHQNFSAGPDFLNARLRIDETLWIGHVEIHKKSSDWRRHGHTNDENYKNVILHAVLEHDEDIFLHQKGDLQVFEMLKNILPSQWEFYKYWLTIKSWIACEAHLPEMDKITIVSQQQRLLVERLESKSGAFMQLYNETSGDWNEVFYRKLSRNFGFKANSEAMEMLATSLPYKIIEKHKSDPFQIEALLFGQAGMLNELFSDDYALQLQKEYFFLCKKYGLRSLNKSIWNYGRLRPSNFPCIRLAQLAALLSQTDHLLSRILHAEEENQIHKLFEVTAHRYWDDHYRMDALTDSPEANHQKKLGDDSIDNIMINTVAVILFAIGQRKGTQDLIDRSIRILEETPSEKNGILTKWATRGITAENAAESQSLLQLYGVYCTTRKCLQCSIGMKIFNTQK